MTTAIVADDEPLLLSYLVSMLKKVWPALTIVGTAGDGQNALELIEKHQPDIAFLDISIPGLTGLEVALQCQFKPKIVFVTAYDEHAIKAFELQAIDYLLKPVEQSRLEQTIEKLKQHDNNASALQSALLKMIGDNEKPEPLKWIKVSQGDEIILINIADVEYFQSSDKYTTVYTKEKSHLIRTSLKDLEPQLDNNVFWRIHRATIINVTSIDKVIKDSAGQLLVTLKTRKRLLPVSRSHIHLFK